MFGGKAIAIKAFIIIIFVILVGWILYSFNFSLPKINIKVQQERKKTNKTRKTKYQKTSISKKISEAKNNQLINESHLRTKGKQDASILKSIIKQKVQQKIEAKSITEKPRINLKFSADKPTFSVSLLKSELGKSNNIDERFLMEKAKALQNKLLEFNVPVSIEGFDI
ncbi:MAG: hypothetical protein GXP45_04375 [bacterium]|nr:hypothetical protein [bacterium]